MQIQRLSFINHKSGWNVRDIEFNRTTLLVGASGVGKTQILNAIETVYSIACGNSLNGIEWSVKFVHDGKSYLWNGSFETIDDDYQEFLDARNERKEYTVTREKLECDGQIIINRDGQGIELDGNLTVKLDLHKSSIFLLKEEDVVKPVYLAFKRIVTFNFYGAGISIFTDSDKMSMMGLDEIRQSSAMDPLHKFFFLKKNTLPEYNRIVEAFVEIFPLVEDVDFEMGHFIGERTFPVLKIKEKGVDSWIYQPNISSGMLRTLTQLIIMELAVDGDVILKDEFENGLGINCIDKLADSILDSDKDIQVIMTSHHPYIINNIDYRDWKVVTRAGSDVHIHTAEDLKIGERSKHDAFMQLINTKAYQTGEA